MWANFPRSCSISSTYNHISFIFWFIVFNLFFQAKLNSEGNSENFKHSWVPLERTPIKVCPLKRYTTCCPMRDFVAILLFAIGQLQHKAWICPFLWNALQWRSIVVSIRILKNRAESDVLCIGLVHASFGVRHRISMRGSVHPPVRLSAYPFTGLLQLFDNRADDTSTF